MPFVPFVAGHFHELLSSSILSPHSHVILHAGLARSCRIQCITKCSIRNPEKIPETNLTIGGFSSFLKLKIKITIHIFSAFLRLNLKQVLFSCSDI